MENKSLEERLRVQAYHLWEADGRPHGRDEEYWQKAREIVERETSLENSAGKASGEPAKKSARSKTKAAPADVNTIDAPKAKSKPAAKKTAKSKASDSDEKKPKAVAETLVKPAKKTTTKTKAAADEKPAAKSAAKPVKAAAKSAKK